MVPNEKVREVVDGGVQKEEEEVEEEEVEYEMQDEEEEARPEVVGLDDDDEEDEEEEEEGTVNWAVWGNAHRLLLQTFLHRKVISHEELLEYVKEKAGGSNGGENGGEDGEDEEETDSEELLDVSVVLNINKKLEEYNMKMLLKKKERWSSWTARTTGSLQANAPTMLPN